MNKETHLLQYSAPEIQRIHDAVADHHGIELFIKREDKIHPFVSGNKWRKLKYNLQEAQAGGHDTLLTFGGAYSNHIYATAAAAGEAGFKSIGIIRGEEHFPLNPTLRFAVDHGMQLHYMDRITYRRKEDEQVIQQLKEKFGRFYLIPEGGTNNLAIRGAEEIVTPEMRTYGYVCVPVGTGGTMAGIIAAMKGSGTVIGFSALKGDFLQKEVRELLENYGSAGWNNWKVNTAYHFGGYAKVSKELFDFIDAFYEKHQIQLEPVYTGKMMFGIFDMIRRNIFERGTKIIAIHTGGLQGMAGFRTGN